MSDNPLARFGELSKPATVLVQKISTAVGGVFKPWQIVRVAKAEAEAERIRAVSEIEISDLHRRALHRFLEEEAKRQSNIEAITEKALPQLMNESKPEGIEDDWITNFFDKSRIVSDDQMQKLWAQVLAGEANVPGTFARRTVNLMGDLDKADAMLFAQLCGFVWQVGNLVPLVFSPAPDDIYSEHGIHFNALSHLESLGLVQFNSVTSFRRLRLPKTLIVHYYGHPVTLTLAKDTDNELRLGNVLLTRAGQELAPVCGSQPIAAFRDFVIRRWVSEGVVSSHEIARATPTDGPRSQADA